MAYNCSYKNADGARCDAWTRETDEYCALHEERLRKVEKMWTDVNDVIKKAREK